MFDPHDPWLIEGQIKAALLVLLVLIGVVGVVITSIRKRNPRNLDLERPENCQRCGRRRKWLYFCECVHDDDNVNHSLHVIKQALERQAERNRLLPYKHDELGLQLVQTLRVMLKDEIERTRL